MTMERVEATLSVCLVLCAFLGAGPPARGEERWWSLRELSRPDVPQVKNREWVRNPIDAFVLEKLEASGLEPGPPADPATLLRRATLDLLGLPPTLPEQDEFLNDRSAEAYEKLVDRLLSSPRYGERWARHWLDLARFSESHGFEYDKIRDHAWRYRDYVIRSFNEDKPYDRFLREQIAGDVMEPFSAEGLVATSFLVAGPWDEAGNLQQSSVMRARAREEELEDIISAVSQTFLALTVNCARCHDHKFDPIPQRDYYRLKAVFGGMRHGNRPLLAPPEARAREKEMARLKEEASSRKERLEALEKKGGGLDDRERAERESLRAELSRAQTALEAMENVPQAYAGRPEEPPPTHVLIRGDVEQKGEEAAAGGLSAVASPPADFRLAASAPEGQRRLKFADWAASAENPLTARVMANRLWQHHFGRGIAATPSDFGLNGERPSHPELLDWLASELIRGGWKLKRLHKLIMLSSAYRQSSRFDARASGLDAENRLLWRFGPRRIEAEAVRDSMLSVSGELNLEMGGRGFRPFTVQVFNSHFYTHTDPASPEYNRRTIYRHIVNSARDPLLESMDCPDPSVKAPSRTITTTPLQSLSLMNGSFVLRQSRRFAERLRKEAGEELNAQLDLVYRLAFCREPSERERQRDLAFLRENDLESLSWVIFNSSEFLYLR